MNQKITHNDIMRFAYNETTTEENNYINKQLNKDFELVEAYHDVLFGQTVLDTAGYKSPSESTIALIMKFGSSTEQQQLQVSY